jgi:NADH:ubiquinone reductase (H+-translocating)
MTAAAAMPRPRVVVVGGGFAGLNTVKSLKRAAVDVVLIDRRNFHLFQPLLYQVATGGLSPANIAAPLRWIFSRQKNCEVMLAEVVGFDLDQKRVHTTQGDVPYDYLIVAAGSRHSYFGRDDWAEFAPGLKTIEDATDIRRRVYSAFEQAETEQDPAVRRALLNFAIVGGGPTGVELAGALAEIARHSLKHDFRQIDPSEASITLVEAGDRVLGSFPEDLSEKAHATLQRLGVHIRSNTMATAIDDKGIEMKSSTGVEHWPTRTVLWAAGVKASPLSKSLASSSDAELDRAGRLIVEKDFSLAGRPEVFVLGDMSSYSHQGGKPLPGVAQPAIQQGRFVARLIGAKLRGRTLPEFHYHDLGNLATIGRSAAVADIKGVHFSGFIAWWLWLVVHLMHIANFRNRLLVLTQWSWNYFTHDRSARLITGDVPSDDDLAALQNLAVPPKATRNSAPAQAASTATAPSTSTTK